MLCPHINSLLTYRPKARFRLSSSTAYSNLVHPLRRWRALRASRASLLRLNVSYFFLRTALNAVTWSFDLAQHPRSPGLHLYHGYRASQGQSPVFGQGTSANPNSPLFFPEQDVIVQTISWALSLMNATPLARAKTVPRSMLIIEQPTWLQSSASVIKWYRYSLRHYSKGADRCLSA